MIFAAQQSKRHVQYSTNEQRPQNGGLSHAADSNTHLLGRVNLITRLSHTHTREGRRSGRYSTLVRRWGIRCGQGWGKRRANTPSPSPGTLGSGAPPFQRCARSRRAFTAGKIEEGENGRSALTEDVRSRPSAPTPADQPEEHPRAPRPKRHEYPAKPSPPSR